MFVEHQSGITIWAVGHWNGTREVVKAEHELNVINAMD
jgi:hypothetical protein